MTCKNTKDIAVFSIIALLALVSFSIPNVHAEESKGYKMIDDIIPVLTFTFRDGVETYKFPVFEMGENFIDNSETSFSVEGTVTSSPLLHQAIDESHKYGFSNTVFDYSFKYFDVDVNFLKESESILTLEYDGCRINNYQVETLDSNDYESYFKEVGFAIVDKINFVCDGISFANDPKVVFEDQSFTDYGESEFNFANNMRTSVTFMFENGMEKIQFPVFNMISGYGKSSENVVAEFQVEGILDHYPLLYNAIDQSRKVSGLSTLSNIDFDAVAEFTNGESTVRGIDFNDCRVSDAQITTQTDKEEGFTGKSGFALVHRLSFLCSGMDGINLYYDELRGDVPIWKTTLISNEYAEPIQNTDRGLSVFATFTFPDGVETIEFSMFEQSETLIATVYSALELRGIVGDYPMLYNHVDENPTVKRNTFRDLIDIDIDLVSTGKVIRGFNYADCIVTDYVVSTDTNKEESYVKNKFALENIFDFECRGYHPNNPAYDAMSNVEKADTQSSNDLRNTQSWGSDFVAK